MVYLLFLQRNYLCQIMNIPITLSIVVNLKLSVNTVYYGTESFLFLGPKILPASFKKQENVEAFKRAIKAWKPGNCLCRLCSVYVQTLVFYEQS